MKQAKKVKREPCVARALVFGSKIMNKIMSYLTKQELGEFRTLNRAFARLGLREMQSLYYLNLWNPFQESLRESPFVKTLAQGFKHMVVRIPEDIQLLGSVCTHVILDCATLKNYPNPLYDLPDSVTHVYGTYVPYPVRLPKDLQVLAQQAQENLLTIPETVTRAHFHLSVIQELPKFPKDLKSLTLNINQDKVIQDLGLPPGLNKLKIRFSNIESPLTGLPETLTKLSIYFKFNIPLDSLPSSLKQLQFSRGCRFNLPLDKLPLGLDVLEFQPGCQFNQPLNKLPPSLRKLILAEQFDQPICQLPPCLKHLQIGYQAQMSRFDQALNSLPPALETLCLFIGGQTNRKGVLKKSSLNSLPKTLLSLTLHLHCNCMGCCDPRLNQIPDHALNNLPPNLKFLSLDCYDGPVDHFPQSLQEARLMGPFNHDIQTLSDSVVSLSLGNRFGHELVKVPKSLRRLSLGTRFTRPIRAHAQQRYTILIMNEQYKGFIDTTVTDDLIVGSRFRMPNMHRRTVSLMDPLDFRRLSFMKESWQESLFEINSLNLSRTGLYAPFSTSCVKHS